MRYDPDIVIRAAVLVDKRVGPLEFVGVWRCVRRVQMGWGCGCAGGCGWTWGGRKGGVGMQGVGVEGVWEELWVRRLCRGVWVCVG